MVSFLRRQNARLLAGLLLLLAARRAAAQCPNGRPPPCQQGTPVVRTTVVVNPRSWIVVPFTNVTHSADLDWLRDASVDLLSMDLGRWNDVDVVPGKRVADLVRERPSTARAEPLTLNDGLAIARRVGAGRLVMGDFFKVGAGARIVATVFDAKTGARIRSFSSDVPSTDSILGAFGPVARDVLALPPPVDARIGDVGTHSLAAYQAYLTGTKALDRHDLIEARTNLDRAVALDSTFALAHLQLSLVLVWGQVDAGSSEARRHALLARQLGASLPKRDRMLIDAQVAQTSHEYARMCEISHDLVAHDSTDVQALDMLGECSYHDDSVDPSRADSTIGIFRNSWNTSIHALTRVLELDPSFLGAFEHVFDILQSPDRTGRVCPNVGAPDQSCTHWEAQLRRAGDSLVVIPARMSMNNNAALFAQQDSAFQEKTRVANLEIAEEIARRWADADRSSENAQLALARVQLARGEVAAADSELRSLSKIATEQNFLTLRVAMEVAAKRGRGTEARALFDSLVKAVPDAPGVDVPRGAMEIAFGRLKRFTRGAVANGTRISPEAAAYSGEVGLAVLGIPRPEMVRAESAYFASIHIAGCNASCKAQRVTATLAYAPHAPTIPAAALDSARHGDARMEPAFAMLRRDTAMLRDAAANQEFQARRNVAQLLSEHGWSMIAAASYLSLHDTTSALRVVRFYVDTAIALSPMMTGMSGAALWGRAMLLRADLARATGSKAEARTWYLRVLDLWADADDELKPTLDRVRAALAALDTKA